MYVRRSCDQGVVRDLYACSGQGVGGGGDAVLLLGGTSAVLSICSYCSKRWGLSFFLRVSFLLPLA